MPVRASQNLSAHVSRPRLIQDKKRIEEAPLPRYDRKKLFDKHLTGLYGRSPLQGAELMSVLTLV